MADEQPYQPPVVVKVLFWLFLLSFFGGGAIMFANLFGRFLPESAFAVIALVHSPVRIWMKAGPVGILSKENVLATATLVPFFT